MGRKATRDTLFKLIFELSFHDADIDSYYDHISDDGGDNIDMQWLQPIYTDIIGKYGELKDDVAKYLHGYTIDRLYRVDLAILVLGLYEIKYTDTDARIVANEAVELAKKYSTDASGKFINGVMASLIKDYRQ